MTASDGTVRSSEALSQAWAALKRDSDARAGIYERRIFARSGRSLFAGIKAPSGALQLLLYVAPELLRNWTDIETRGFVLRADLKVVVSGTVRVRLEVTHPTFVDLFTRLCVDAVDAILGAPDDARAIEAMRIRVDHWCRFLRRAGLEGLSDEAQAGLFGELTFLRVLLAARCAPSQALAAWRGPLGANQDFLFGKVAIEIKTTLANVDTRITVSNERQLDDTGLQLLGLCNMSLDRREHVPTTLPDLVTAIASSLEPSLVLDFTARLLSAGYHEADASRYQLYGYTLRKKGYYHVRDGFPRIVPAGLNAGVSSVRYVVDLAGANNYAMAEEDLIRAVI